MLDRQVEQRINSLVRQITGKDEYIFNSPNKSIGTIVIGKLRNKLHFRINTERNMLIVSSDDYSVIWSIDEHSTTLMQVVEYRAVNAYVSTCYTGHDNKTTVLICSGRLILQFDHTEITTHDTIMLGKMPIDVPRGWFNSEGPIVITANSKNKLIHSVLGNSLTKEGKECLYVRISKIDNGLAYEASLANGDPSNRAQETFIPDSEIYDAKATMACIASILSD